MSINTGINYQLTSGDSVGLQPTYQWNAEVISGSIQLYDQYGNIVADSYTSEGDHITVLDVCPVQGLALIQLPDQGNSCYVQGWIQISDFSQISFRFNNCWENINNGQEVEFHGGGISGTTLNANQSMTFLYSVGGTYACVMYPVSSGSYAGIMESGYVPLNSCNLNIIQTEIPFWLAPGSTVGTEPTYPTNAQTVASSIGIVDINGISIPNNYTSNGDNITILDVYMEEELALIEFPDSYAGTYVIGYIPVNNLTNGNVTNDSNYCNWNNSNGTYPIYDLTEQVVYDIPASQTTEYLFQTSQYVCILFNNNNVSNWPLQSGYVSVNNGSFGLSTSNDSAPSSTSQPSGNTPSSTNQPSGSTPSSTGSTINASLLEKAAIMIALDEGFVDHEYTYGVGPYASSAGYGTSINDFLPSDYPITPESAWNVLLRVLENNYIPTCDAAINQYFPEGLSDCQKCAIYTFGYNLEGYVPALVQKLAQNDSWDNTFANFLIPSNIEGRRYRSWKTFYYNKYDLFMCNLSMLPNNELMQLAQEMNGNS